MAGSLRPDEIQLRVLIDGSPARKELVDLSQLTAKLRDEQKRLKEQQDKLRDDKRAAQAKGDMAAVRELTKAEAQLREERGRNNAAIVEAEKKSAELRKGIGLEALSVRELRNELRAAKSAYDAATPKTEQWVQARTRLDQVNTALNRLTKEANIQQQVWERIRGQYKLTDMTIEQLELELQRLRGLLHTMAPKDTGLGKVQADIRATERQLAAMRTGLGPFGRMWGEVKSQVAAAGAVLAGMFAAGGIVNGFQGLVRSSKEYSDQLADVRKTTGLTGDAVKALASEISRIDTRTSRQELLALARDAGKLGISGRDDIMAFVQAGNQIRTALGEDLGDDAIKNIAKLVDIFRLKEEFGLEQSMLKIGSAMNELGMASTASEGYMADFLRRLGPIGPQAGISADQILALAATLDSLGQTSEVSTTVLSKLFVKMGSDVERFAQIAGISVEEFKRLLQQDFTQAFLRVLDGTKQAEGGVVGLAESMADLDIDAARATGVIGALSGNTDVLRKQLELAKQAFDEGNSVTDEYALKNNNLAAQIEKLGKEFNRLFANNTMVAWLERLVGITRESIAWMQRHRDAVVFFVRVLVAAAASFLSYKAAVAATNLVTNAYRIATATLAATKALLTTNVGRATAAMRVFNTVTKMNPLGLVLSVLSAVVALFADFGVEVEAATEKQKEFNAVSEETRRQMQAMDDLRKGTNVIEQMNREQVLSHKRKLEEMLSATEEANAKALAQEQVDQQTILTLRDRFAKQAAEARERAESETIPNLKQKYLARERQFLDAAKQEDERLAKLKEGTYRRLSTMQTDADRKALQDQIAAADARLAQLGVEAVTTVRTVAVINEEIRRLQEQQENASDPAKYKQLQSKIDQLEKERERITGAKNAKAAQQNQDHLDDLLRQYQEFEGRLRLDTLTDDQRELEELDLKHAAELDKVRKQQAELIKAKKLTPDEAQADLGALGAQQAKERANLIEQQGDRRLDLLRQNNAAISALLNESRKQQLDDELAAVESEIAIAQSKGQSIVELEQRKRDILLRIYEQNTQDAIDATTKKYEEILKIEKARLEAMQQEAQADGVITDEEQVRLNEQLSLVKSLEAAKDAIIRGITEKRHREMADAERNFANAQRQEMARQVQGVVEWGNIMAGVLAGVLQIRDAEIQAAEQRADADNKRSEEEIAGLQRLQDARKRTALTHLAVQAATAIASAVASALASTIPFPGNLLAAAPAVGTVLGLIAQARAILNSTDGSGEQTGTNASGAGSLQTVPYGAEGLQARDGKVLRAADGGGVLGGSYHTQGGNTLYDDRTGRPLANVERDELMLIMSRRATEANRDLIPMLLDASRRGARLPVLQRPVAMPSAQRVRQAMGVPSMAQGGTLYTFTKATGMARAPGDPPPSDPAMLHALQAVVSETRAARRATERIRTLRVSLLDEQRRRSEYALIQQLNKGSRAS